MSEFTCLCDRYEYGNMLQNVNYKLYKRTSTVVPRAHRLQIFHISSSLVGPTRKVYTRIKIKITKPYEIAS